MEPFPSAGVRTLWDGSTQKGSSSRKQTRSAVEKAGAWKPVETRKRFPPAPPLPWKSRPPREIFTFPPRRLRVVFPKQNPKPRRLTPPKTQDRTTHVLIKPDNLKS